MSYTPEALRLADRLTLDDYYEFDASLHCPRAAAELRRLHAQNERLKAHIVGQTNRLAFELLPMAESLEAQRDDLLAALNAMLTHMGMDEDEWNKPTFEQARAAIAKAEGSQT